MAGDIASVSAIPQGVARTASPLPVITAPPETTLQTTDGGAASSKRPLVNPSLHVDVALNLVVIEFINDQGTVTSSIPTPKQLKAYRENASGADDGKGASAKKVAAE